MIASTAFSLLFVPSFFVVLQRLESPLRAVPKSSLHPQSLSPLGRGATLPPV
jgi:hypothetical protein